jgi:hypothetical protein
MTRPAFWPRLVGLEDRLTPATPQDVVADVALMQADTEILQFAVAHPQIGLAPANRALARSYMATIVGQSQAALADLNQFLADLGSRSAVDPSLVGFYAPYVERATRAAAQAQANITWATFAITQIDAAAGTTGTGTGGPTGPPTGPSNPPFPNSTNSPFPDTTTTG